MQSFPGMEPSNFRCVTPKGFVPVGDLIASLWLPPSVTLLNDLRAAGVPLVRVRFGRDSTNFVALRPALRWLDERIASAQETAK